MTLPNPFILAVEAKEHQRFLLQEAEALRLHRTNALQEEQCAPWTPSPTTTPAWRIAGRRRGVASR